MPSPVAPITLTAAGLSPDRADRATFVARSIARDDFIKNTQIPQLQSAITNVYNNSLEAYNSGVSATADAASSAINASQAASASAATQWVSGTTYAVGDARWSPVTKISYRRIVAGAGTTDPSADATNWGAIVAPLAAGGTGATTAAAARTALGATTTGDAIFIAATKAAARIALGGLIQQVRTESGALTTCTTIIPNDDTIPQITEGDLVLSQAITPLAATSRLLVEVSVRCAANAAVYQTAALFRDGAANSIGAAQNVSATADYYNGGLNFSVEVIAGSVAATTFTVRLGPSAAASVYFNGQAGSRRLGGVSASSISITEIL